MIKKNKYLQFLGRDSRNSQGLTLIEVITVFAVIAIMATVAVPIISTAAQGARVRGAARKVALDLRFAKASAVQQNVPFFLTFNATTNSYALTCGNAAAVCSGVTPPGPKPVPNVLLDSTYVAGVPGVVPFGTLFPGVTFSATAGGVAVNPACVGFSAGQGAMITCAGGAGVQTILTITNGTGMTRTVQVNTPTGSTTIQ